MLGNISGVRKHSLAEAAGIKAGEKLLSVCGTQVKDIIELSFYTSDYEVELEIENVAGEKRLVNIAKHPDEDLGIEFESAVFDKVSTCYNNCIFCFVDQMIPGMRPGLYVRDDDFRLSFLYGNFITLTNMKDEDFNRIITTHMSPLYVSVHATDPQVRCQMMNNRFAGELMDKLHRLLDAGIQVHTQIVCCPGYNDGEVLAKTFADLYALHPGVLTMAIVPVGLTKNREHLHPLRTFTKEEAAAIVDMVTPWQERCRKETGKSFVYLGDEFYLLAEKELPPAAWYDGFPQLENGIGLTSSFLIEWEETLKVLSQAQASAPAVIPVGESAYKVLKPVIAAFNEKYNGQHQVLAVKNEFFGGKVNVTGLLVGGDILAAVPKDARVILPAVVLNKDNLFLDDMSFDEFKKLHQGTVEVAVGAKELLHLLTVPKEG
jgi:putative radical SAM enzyme (TIGR03279 family)